MTTDKLIKMWSLLAEEEKQKAIKLLEDKEYTKLANKAGKAMQLLAALMLAYGAASPAEAASRADKEADIVSKKEKTTLSPRDNPNSSDSHRTTPVAKKEAVEALARTVELPPKDAIKALERYPQLIKWDMFMNGANFYVPMVVDVTKDDGFNDTVNKALKGKIGKELKTGKYAHLPIEAKIDILIEVFNTALDMHPKEKKILLAYLKGKGKNLEKLHSVIADKAIDFLK